MHKDIFIFLKEHEEKANKIVDLHLENTVRSDYQGVINICGISGTGKSEIAWWVARKLYKLGISSHVVNLDRYYKIEAVDREAWRKKNNYIGHKEIDWDRVDEELKMFSNNAIKVIIFEGIYAGYSNGLTFYIEGNIESSDEFRRMRGKEDEESEWRQYVVGEEYSDILSGKRFYDYTI